MPDLSFGQFNLVYNMFSFTIATMFAAFAFFVMARQQVAPKFRPAMIVSALVVGIAGYHYWRIFGSWSDAYALIDGSYKATGTPFNDAYRYVDWLLTVPLLLVELVAVLGLAAAASKSLLTRLIIASVAMIALGYPGEVASDFTTQAVFFVLSCIPFVYILMVLTGELGRAVEGMSGKVKGLISTTRTIILVTWMFYPIAYLFNMFDALGPAGEIGVQVGYTIADVTAKALYGVWIYLIAKAKSDEMGYEPS
jgi:bacteriorhodopsin